MADELTRCAICQEEFAPSHQIVSPEPCHHTFHTICIHVWLTHHKSCPVCQQQIQVDQQLSWRTLFATALVITQEAALERAAYTYAFLSAMNRRFKTAEAWNHAKPIIVVAAEQLEAGIVRLPYLDLSSRSTAKREKQKWATIFQQIDEDGGSARTSPRVKAARRWIVDRLFFMFAD